MVRVSDRDSEWVGLLLHRRSDACSDGYLVALPFTTVIGTTTNPILAVGASC